MIDSTEPSLLLNYLVKIESLKFYLNLDICYRYHCAFVLVSTNVRSVYPLGVFTVSLCRKLNGDHTWEYYNVHEYRIFYGNC